MCVKPPCISIFLCLASLFGVSASAAPALVLLTPSRPACCDLKSNCEWVGIKNAAYSDDLSDFHRAKHGTSGGGLWASESILFSPHLDRNNWLHSLTSLPKNRYRWIYSGLSPPNRV